jgi:hypothetical protein
MVRDKFVSSPSLSGRDGNADPEAMTTPLYERRRSSAVS